MASRHPFSVLMISVFYQQLQLLHPHPLFGKKPHPLFPPHPPNMNKRMSSRQLLSHPPHPLLPPQKFIPLPLPHRENRIRSQHQEIPLLLLSHPHVQFVAVKSFISNPPKLIIYSVLYVTVKMMLLKISFKEKIQRYRRHP